MTDINTAARRYEHLSTFREFFLSRAREGSELTIPSLLPPGDHPRQGSQVLYTPFQSVGARGVNNLGAKLLLALFPPGEPFFRLALDDFVVRELAAEAGNVGPDPRTAFEEALGSIERAVMNRMEQMQMRPTMAETLKHLVVTGNGLLYVGPKGKARLFHLDQYVIKRAPDGEVLEHITKEYLSPADLPPEVAAVLEPLTNPDESPSADKLIPLYTWVQKAGNKFIVHQEIKDKVVPGSFGVYPLEKTPWIPLRFNQIDGEDYGRGYVEEYIGDIKSLESLEQALVEGSAAAAKVIVFVRPGGVTSKKKVSECASGAVIGGNADDVTGFQLDKFPDFQVTQLQANKIEKRLSAAFLISSQQIRDAERVTAEEIRIVAGELEDALGGIYSLLSQDLQLRLVNRVMFEMEREGKLPALPKNTVTPQIITGLEALGRRRDLDRLDIFIDRAVKLVGPDNLPTYLNPGPLLKRTGVALGIDTEGVIKSEEEVQAAAQAARQAEMMQSLGPDAIQQVGKMAQPPKGE
jgi:hypothetical protein